ncbi:hypothetical protein T01_11541, partial [Trichinella spiralis]
MCWASSGRSHAASSTIEPLTSNATPIASELASTQILASSAETSHLPRAGSRFFTANAVSWISSLSSSPSITSSQLVVASLAFLLMYAAAILSHPQTGKWLTSFPQYENTERRVNTSGTSPTSLSRLHISFPRSPQTFSPRRRA